MWRLLLVAIVLCIVAWFAFKKKKPAMDKTNELLDYSLVEDMEDDDMLSDVSDDYE